MEAHTGVTDEMRRPTGERAIVPWLWQEGVHVPERVMLGEPDRLAKFTGQPWQELTSRELVHVTDQHEIIRLDQFAEPGGHLPPLSPLTGPRIGVVGVELRHDMMDAPAPLIESSTVDVEVQRLRLAGEGPGALDDHKPGDVVVEFCEPVLEQVEFVVEEESVPNQRHVEPPTRGHDTGARTFHLMDYQTLASVVILNWNGGARLVRAVQSVLDQTHLHLELIVVDNGSTDDSLAHLPENSRLRVIENGQNLGYARGMNVGWSASRGDLWVPMNDDAVLHRSFIERAIRRLELDSHVGAIAPLVLRSDDSGQLPWEGEAPAELDSGPESLTLDMRVTGDGRLDRARRTFKANGSCPAYRRVALEDILERVDEGPFDPWFDTYGEDVDLAFRLWSLGWSTSYEPDVLATHARGASSAERIHDKRGRLRRNLVAARHANAWRHLTAGRLPIVLPLLFLADLTFVLLSLPRRDPRAAVDVMAAWVRVGGSLPSLWAERRRIPPRRHADVGIVRLAARRARLVELSNSVWRD